MSHTRESVGEELRVARMAAGITQAEAGKHIGVTRSSIANLEAGRTVTSASNYLNLMELYGGTVPEPHLDELVVWLRNMRQHMKATAEHMKATADLLHSFADSPYIKNGDGD